MKKLGLLIILGFCLQQIVIAQQSPVGGINSRIQPPLEPHDISEQVKRLEGELATANREANFWRNARFYNDKKKERMRQEKLVYWAQRTVVIRNQITELKKDRSYYQHKNYGDQKYYYKKN